MNDEMKKEIMKRIWEFKKASEILQLALNYDKNGEEYRGMEEVRERVEKFCLGYDDHMALNNLT
ncbi:hypothetical protein K4H03_30900, partial [Mycobacterium tuberculosis]|nr:hypothetical protein [Mycobacterium tuberculosis]